MNSDRFRKSNRKPSKSRSAEVPFNSRVRGFNDLGLNPTKKIIVTEKKKVDPNSILMRHRRFLKELEKKKNEEKENAQKTQETQNEKMEKVKQQAEV